MDLNDKGKLLYDRWDAKYYDELKRLREKRNEQTYTEGTCIIENSNFIKTLEDVVGYLMITFAENVIMFVDWWIEDFGEEHTFFGFRYIDIKHELEKYFE